MATTPQSSSSSSSKATTFQKVLEINSPIASGEDSVFDDDNDGSSSSWNCANPSLSSTVNKNTSSLIVDPDDIDSSSLSQQRQPRRIGYGIVKASPQLVKDVQPNTSIIMFCSLSGNSLLTKHYNVHGKLKGDFLVVDRPGCGETTECILDPNKNPSETRIQQHVDDVLHVLREEKISNIYILGVCIGHVFAMELVRRLEGNDSDYDQYKDISVKGITLVAPFVSTACPNSWSVARWANAYVPRSVLYYGTEGLSYVKKQLTPILLTSSALQSLLEEDEIESGDWQEEDFEQVVSIVSDLNGYKSTNGGEEARLGVDPIWQEAICDRVGKEVMLEPVGDKKDNNTTADGEEDSTTNKIPFCIHATRQDRIAPWASVRWVAKRCYGGSGCIVEEKGIHSHEVMTFLGGPPRNPVMLYQIAARWGLIDLPVDVGSKSN